LLPIANRPMVWYPLEWCYRMGVTGRTLRMSLLYVFDLTPYRHHSRHAPGVARSHRGCHVAKPTPHNPPFAEARHPCA
jgi:hypothetical protein